MDVHIIYTGGTIGMVDSPHGLVPGADLEGWLDSVLKGTPLARSVSVTSLAPLIDSSNATPLSWQAIVDDLRAHAAADPQTAFVILHGTDTMAYTSAALSYALTDLSVPVVVTGSQLPLGELGTDAAANVTGALKAATSGRLSGVALFFGHRLLAGNRVTKSSSWAFTGFESPNAAPLATTGAPWQWAPSTRGGAGWKDAAPYARHDVVVVDLVPGITAARLEALLTPLPELTDVVERVIDAGTAVIVTSQCHESEVLLGHYEAGDALARSGAVGSRDMTLEAAYAKVQFLLSQGLTGDDLAGWMGRSIAGELSQ